MSRLRRSVGWWAIGAVAVVLVAVVLPRELQRGRAATAVRDGEPVPGQLQIAPASEPVRFEDSPLAEQYVLSVRELAGGVMDEDRIDREDLIGMGRRICLHLRRDDIQTTRDYVREYRSQRRDLGFPVFKELLVQGAAVAETAPPVFCPEFVGAVSAREAARIVGYDG